MHIGIITFSWAYNYGAVLQTYALQRVLECIGHSVEVIDYRPSWASENKRPPFPKRPGAAIGFIDHYIRKKTFVRFCNKKLHLTGKRYAYGEAVSGFDCIITGSDQVFNPDIIASGGQLDDTYLLASVAEGTKRLSYAASFGNSTLAEEYQERFRTMLGKFSGIGIREESGKKVIADMGLNAIAVPDPTILLGDFSQLTGIHEPTDDYVLNFIFQPSEAARMASDVIAGESCRPMRAVTGLRGRIAGRNAFYNLSPENWISVIRNAHFVVTDSFHSTVFCILNHRPFVSLVLDAWGGDWSERIKSLLIRLGLGDRLLSAPTEEQIKNMYNTPVDWERVDQELAGWRCEGMEFLSDNLK